MYLLPFYCSYFYLLGGYQITLFEGMVQMKGKVDDLVQDTEKVKVTPTCTYCFGDQGSHSRGFGKAA